MRCTCYDTFDTINEHPATGFAVIYQSFVFIEGLRSSE